VNSVIPLLPNFGNVQPFGLKSLVGYRVAAGIPAFDSQQYELDYAEVPLLYRTATITYLTRKIVLVPRFLGKEPWRL
jgi:hypothetical protein